MGRTSFKRRAQEQLRRVLCMVDAMAPLRFPHSLDEIRRLVIDRTAIVVCRRTVRRDLQLLEDMGLASASTTDGRQRWRLDLRGSEGLQCAACVLVDCGEPVRGYLVLHESTAGRRVYHPEAMTRTMAESMAATLRAAGIRASVETVRIRCSAEAV